MLPGYGPHLRGRIKEMELRAEREAENGEDGLDHARELDADEVERRAELQRLQRAAPEHRHEPPAGPR
jgi:hypothetical protein